MAIYSTDNARIYTSDPHVYSLTPSWVEIGETETIEWFGIEYEEITHSELGSHDTIVRGPRKPSKLALTFASDPDDAGQSLLRKGVDPQFESISPDYRIRIVLNDAPTGGTPSERTCQATLLGLSEGIDRGGMILRTRASFSLVGEIARVERAEA